MTANAGKGANGKPAQRSTGADGKGGRPRKKTSSAAKPPSDEVTLRTDKTNRSAREEDSDDTLIDVPAKDDAKDDDASADKAPDDDATVVDAAPVLDSSESASDRTATFGLPKDFDSDPENTDSGKRETEPISPGTLAIESVKNDNATKFSQESGESVPSSGRSAAMDAPTPPGRGYGSNRGTPPGGGGSSYGSGGPGGRPALESAAARVSKLTGALRKPDREPGRKPPRKAHLQVAKFEPWSVMKFSFIMALVSFLVLFVAVAVLYVILSSLGVFDALSNTIHDLTSNDQGKSGGINPASWFSAARILGYTALIGTLNVLLITALATVWSVIYNMAADLVGGVEVTLKEAE